MFAAGDGRTVTLCGWAVKGPQGLLLRLLQGETLVNEGCPGSGHTGTAPQKGGLGGAVCRAEEGCPPSRWRGDGTARPMGNKIAARAHRRRGRAPLPLGSKPPAPFLQERTARLFPLSAGLAAFALSPLSGGGWDEWAGARTAVCRRRRAHRHPLRLGYKRSSAPAMPPPLGRNSGQRGLPGSGHAGATPQKSGLIDAVRYTEEGCPPSRWWGDGTARPMGNKMTARAHRRHDRAPLPTNNKKPSTPSFTGRTALAFSPLSAGGREGRAGAQAAVWHRRRSRCQTPAAGSQKRSTAPATPPPRGRALDR